MKVFLSVRCRILIYSFKQNKKQTECARQLEKRSNMIKEGEMSRLQTTQHLRHSALINTVQQ